MATEFNASVMVAGGGDYTSLLAAEAGLQNDYTLATVKVFSISAASATTIAAGDTVLGLTSGATGVCVLVNAVRTQILIKTIAVASFLSGETVKKTADATKTVTLSDAGDSPAIHIQGISGTDTSAAVLSGYGLSATNYLKVSVPPNNRHHGKWDSTKYNISTSGAGNEPLSITGSSYFIYIEGLQLAGTSAGGNAVNGLACNPSGSGKAYISNCIVKDLGVGRGNGISVTSAGTYTIYIKNCIVYDFLYEVSPGKGIACADGSVEMFIYNCTVQNCMVGISRTFGTATAKNCTVKCFANNAAYTDYSGSFTDGNNNVSSDGTAPGTSPRINQTITFKDEANDDFHLGYMDTSSRGYGADLSADANLVVVDDIDIQTRRAPPDCGADQLYIPRPCVIQFD